VVQRLLQPVLGTPDLRLVCHEGEMADLLADLAMHRLDVVLSDHPAPFNPHLKVHNHSLGISGMGWYASQHWWKLAQKISRVIGQGARCCPLHIPPCAGRWISG
jgi:LysR family transcriptional activator of nhaA